jgi:predicted transcriptional regulator of viral defense system
MKSLDTYLDRQLARGRAWFTKEEAVAALAVGPRSFVAAAERLAKKQRLARLRKGFYLILRPEDKVAGAPDPARWIDPLLNSLKLDYRISLLRAAAFHGSAHQAAMVFQVVVPKQIRPIALGRHRVEFVYQAPAAFRSANRPDWLSQLKTPEGFAKVAGIELTLLDCTRYFHRAAGINGVAQIVHDLGGRTSPRVLAAAAHAYENSAVRRLGYLLDKFGHERAAKALLPFVRKAKSFEKLDPPVRQIVPVNDKPERDARWKLVINEPVEIDT